MQIARSQRATTKVETLVWTVITACSEFFLGLRKDFRLVITRGLIYTLFGLSAWVFISIGHEKWDVRAGFRAAFTGEDVVALAESQSRAMQAQLQVSTVSDRLIMSVLGRLLKANPAASRVRMAVIHNGVAGITGSPMLRFDVPFALARPGRDPGPPLQNAPLSDWVDYLPALLADKCAVTEVAKLSSPLARDRLSQTGIARFNVCPIMDVYGRLLGAVFMSYEANDGFPAGAALEEQSQQMRSAGRQIGVALDTRTPLLAPELLR